MSNMSFVPDEYRKKKMQVRVNTINLSLFIVVMAGVVGAFFVTDKNRSLVTEELRVVNSKYGEAAELLKDLQELEGKKALMIRKAQIITQLVEKVPRSLLLAELINSMPESMSLDEITLITQKQKRRGGRSRTAMERARKLQEKNKKRQKKSKGKKGVVSAPKLPPQEVLLVVLGVAPSDTEVTQFMASLKLSTMFSRVNWIFSEETEVDDQKMRKFRFEMLVNEKFDVNDHKPKLLVRNKIKKLMDVKGGLGGRKFLGDLGQHAEDIDKDE